MKRILLTGATGRVGANLIPKLLDSGYAVRAFTMPGDPQRKKLDRFDVEVAEGVMFHKGDAERAMDGCDSLIHLGALIVPGAISERQFWDINVNGTFEMVRAAVHHKVERIMLASTDATYSCWNPAYSPIDEAHPQHPFFLYGATKIACEAILFEAWRESGIPVVAMRFSNVKCADEILDQFTVAALHGRLKGYSSHPSSVVYVPEYPHAEVQIADLMDDPGRFIIPYGPDLRCWREHHVDVRDLIQGILLCLTKDEAVGQAFNLAAPEASSWEVAVKHIGEKTGKPYLTRQLANLWSYDMNIEKAKKLLGYAPVYDVKRMIDDAVAYRGGADLGLIPTVI